MILLYRQNGRQHGFDLANFVVSQVDQSFWMRERANRLAAPQKVESEASPETRPHSLSEDIFARQKPFYPSTLVRP